ncbi:hypothetical protein GCM10025868_01470 [Angustibacter aerolatus]|uniref:Mini-circle protein n=1 Tax=Angustibacter aerolatus TaxID=1162965 RepID=A0ABQ6J9P8_9ACTN|nr:hypothetical protein GCM10025868_01470 [Angustibacter aerolatus]
MRHLTKVERIWLRLRAAHEDVPPVFDPALGRDHDFDAVDPADAEAAVAALQAEWAAGQAAVAGLDWEHEVVDRDGEVMSLRMVHVHLVGEYARHNGHADLLREAIDGVTGR